MDLNPSDASARLWYGEMLVSTGRFEEGIRQVRLAHELDPLSAFIETGLGQVYFLSGQYSRALQQFKAWSIPIPSSCMAICGWESLICIPNNMRRPDVNWKRRSG
jgi:hypothetical protein